jgi:hypothetical protein
MAIIIKKIEGDGFSQQFVYILVGVSNGTTYVCDRHGRISPVPDPRDYAVASIDGKTPMEIIQENSEE